MKIKPMFDRVLVTAQDQTHTTEAGIVMPATSQERPIYATIVAVGEGGLVDGNEVKMVVKVGQRIIFNKYAGSEIKLDGKEYILLKQVDILAVVED